MLCFFHGLPRMSGDSKSDNICEYRLAESGNPKPESDHALDAGFRIAAEGPFTLRVSRLTNFSPRPLANSPLIAA